MKFLVLFLALLVNSIAFAQTAEDVIFAMDIDDIIFVENFDESSDPNNQLGRPNQYIEKASWPDKRIDPLFESDGYYDPDTPAEDYKGGTIEKFKSINDLNRRYSYIKNIHLNMPVLNEYMYKKGLFLMRLNKLFTPTQAKEYEKEFNRVVK